MTRSMKVNLGMALSRNYDKISFEILDEPIQFETAEEFDKKVQEIFEILKRHIDEQFQNVQK